MHPFGRRLVTQKQQYMHDNRTWILAQHARRKAAAGVTLRQMFQTWLFLGGRTMSCVQMLASRWDPKTRFRGDCLVFMLVKEMISHAVGNHGHVELGAKIQPPFLRLLRADLVAGLRTQDEVQSRKRHCPRRQPLLLQYFEALAKMATLAVGDSFPEGVTFSCIPYAEDKEGISTCGVPVTYDASKGVFSLVLSLKR